MPQQLKRAKPSDVGMAILEALGLPASGCRKVSIDVTPDSALVALEYWVTEDGLENVKKVLYELTPREIT
jgi:hypothetical protein